MKHIKLTIDNIEVEVAEGATILDAAQLVGITIPTLCFLRGYSPAASCMVCAVKVNGSERFVPSCAMPVAVGMVVESETEEVHAARRMALELLLGDHLGDCIAPCQSVCPAHMDIPLMLRQVAAGQYREAIINIKNHLPLPATLGRICPELCERGCRRAQSDGALAICDIQRVVADADLASSSPYIPELPELQGTSVGIVGAGLAGLSATYYLRHLGYAVTLYNAHEKAGGTLRSEVIAEQLPAAVLDSEIALLLALPDVTFIPRVRIGDDISLSQLQQRHAAVLLTCGALTPVKKDALRLPDNFLAQKNTHSTEVPGVFAAGSLVVPFRYAIQAVADGHSAALTIAQYLGGSVTGGETGTFSVHIGRLHEDEMAVMLASAATTPRNRNVLTLDDARSEAQRCLHCDCRKLTHCKLREYAMVYGARPTHFKGERRLFSEDRSHPAVIYEPGKCIDCGICLRLAEEAREAYGLTFIGRGFTMRMGTPFELPLAEGLCTVARECARACPTGALAMKDDDEGVRS